MKHKTIVIDDEKLARDVIKKHLEKYPEFKLIAECANGFDGIKTIQTMQPDVVFLDVQMPKLTGFEMLELLLDPPVIIFVTAYDQYALKAFEANAIDYLLKPFSTERFAEAIRKIRHFLDQQTSQQPNLSKLTSAEDAAPEALERIVVKDGSKITVIPIEKIYHIEAQDDYVMLHTEIGKFLKQKTMRFYENNLPETDFLRVHRSHIVRLSAIRQIDLMGKESYQLELSDGSNIPASKSGYRKLKDVIG